MECTHQVVGDYKVPATKHAYLGLWPLWGAYNRRDPVPPTPKGPAGSTPGRRSFLPRVARGGHPVAFGVAGDQVIGRMLQARRPHHIGDDGRIVGPPVAGRRHPLALLLGGDHVVLRVRRALCPYKFPGRLLILCHCFTFGVLRR